MNPILSESDAHAAATVRIQRTTLMRGHVQNMDSVPAKPNVIFLFKMIITAFSL